MAHAQQHKLLPGVAALWTFLFFTSRVAVDARGRSTCNIVHRFERLGDICLVVLGGFEARFDLLGNATISLAGLYTAIYLGEIVFSEECLCLFWRLEVREAPFLRQEAHLVDGSDIVRSVRNQDNGVSLVGQFAQ